MINVTVAGRLGKDAETREAGSSTVCGFSVAGNTGFGDRKQTHWFECSLWGNQGLALAQYLKKGQQVTVIGEYSEREYQGKQYKEIRVHSVELQGAGDGQQQSQGNNGGYSQPQQPQGGFNQQQGNNGQQGYQNAPQGNQGFNQPQQGGFANQQGNPATSGGGAVDEDIPFNKHFDGVM